MQKNPEEFIRPEEKPKDGFRSESRTDVRLSGSYGGKSAEYTETVMFEGPNSISDYDLVIPVSQVSGTIKLADFEDIPEVRFEEEDEAGGDFYRENSAAGDEEEDILNTDPDAVRLDEAVYFPEENVPSAGARPRKESRAGGGSPPPPADHTAKKSDPAKTDSRPPQESRPDNADTGKGKTYFAKNGNRASARTQTESRKDRRSGKASGRKKSVLGPLAAAVVLLLAAGLATGYYHYYRYFQNHFYAGTTINGTDVSYQTAETVKAQLHNSLQNYTLAITERDGVKEVLTAEQLGWTYQDDGAVDDLMAAQDSGKWILHTKDSHDYTISVGSAWSMEKVQAAIGHLKALSASWAEAPENASILLTEDGFYEIIPESEGNEIDRTKLDQAVASALSEGKTEIDLTDPDCYRHPDVYSDDPVLVARRDAWNRFMSISLVYQFGSSEEIIDADVIRTCLEDDGTKVTISTDWITPMVKSWAKKYDTLGQKLPFTTHSGKKVTAEGGDYGWSLDIDATIQAVTADILAGMSGEREAVWASEGMGWDNSGLTWTYIEISLAAQKLWFYRDGELAVQCDIVSGSRGEEETPTQKGVYSIDAKEVLKTPDVAEGDAEDNEGAGDIEETEETEETDASPGWWIPFNGSQGIKDAPGRKLFGKRIYRTDGTDGSVEIPSSAMQSLFDAVEVGTAVVIY